MTRRGRPSVLTEDVLARVAELAGLGKSHSEIARETGISRRSVLRVLNPCAKSAQGTNGSEEVLGHG